MIDEAKQTQVGQYYLMEKVAQGGMAEIFKGLSYDVHGLKKTVCIKRILPHLSANKEFIDSLIDEAKLAVRLVHGNIAQTYDLGKVGSDYFMVMEFVDGKTLSQINKKCQLDGGLIPIPYLAYFISEVANGLDYMHRRTDDQGNPLNVVHRDISPQNIMVSYSGTVKIIDFGIAKAASMVDATDAGILKGKFAYMSPEQAMGEDIDHRSDIFSLGIILHEMLVGQRLFKALDSRQTIRNVRRAKASPPSSVREEIPEVLDRIVMRALSKDRRHRYPYASELRDDIVKFLHANYPDFKSSDAAQFVVNLFKEERGRAKPVEADAKTPHLIIDHTSSALAGESQFEPTGRTRSPFDMREYMLEDLSVKDEGRDNADKDDISQSVKFEAEEKTKALWRKFLYIRKGVLAWVFAVLIAGTAIFALARFLVTRPSPVEEPKSAEALVTTVPSDASVSLDGRFEGQGSPITIKNIEAGTDHKIEAKKEGYVALERIIHPSPGEFLSLEFKLVPVKPASSTLELKTEPPGAKVFINDVETEYKTPATIEGLTPGREISIGLYLPGHRFWSRKITLEADEEKSFDVNFAKDFASLYIDSVPSESLVMINGAPVGQTPLTKDNIEPDKIYRIEIWHEGYKTFSEEIKAAAGHKKEIRARLEPETKIQPERPHKEGGASEGKKDVSEPEKKKPSENQPKKIIDTPAPIQ